MPGLIHKIGKIIGAPEKGALATSAVLLSLDLMGGSGLFSAAGAATGVVQSGIGKTICEALKGSIGGYLPALFQNLENSKTARENHTNFKLFMEATETCIKEVRTWFLESYDLQKNWLNANKDRKKAKKLFNEFIVEPMMTFFTNDRVEDLFLQNRQFSVDQFIEEAFHVSVNFNSPELMDYRNEKDLIRQEFCSIFRKKFLDQIRILVSSNPSLKDSYHTFLMHQILQAMSTQRDLDAKLTEVLLVLKQQTGETHLPRDPEILARLESLEKKNTALLDGLGDFIKKHQLPDLQYIPPMKSPDKMQLGYSYRYTRYVGREEDLMELHHFMNDQAVFRWMMVGGKAGQGKSRIGQELCDAYAHRGWHVGFWPSKLDKANFSWAQFTPDHAKGVLIIFDYIVGKEKEIKYLLQRIALRMQDLESNGLSNTPVRVLLLEREFSRDWLEGVQLLDHVGDKIFVPRQRKSNQPSPVMQLTGLSDQDLLMLMKEVVNRPMNAEEEARLLEQLVAIDPAKRPLFAFILGWYIKENGFTEELTQWSRIEQPLKYILVKEENDWEKTPVWQRQSGFIARTAIFMAALTQKIGLNRIHQALEQYMKGADRVEKEAIAQLFRITSHFQEGIRDSHCLGLQPDLLAEYWLVRHFVQLEDMDESALLLNIAYNLEPEMASAMLVKTEQNFRHHQGFSHILHWLKDRVTEPRLELEKAQQLSRLILGFFQSNTPKETDKYDLPYLLVFFEHLKHLQLSFPEDLELARTFAQSAQRYNYYFAAKKDPQPEEALHYLVDYGVALRGYSPFKTDPDLALRQVKGARNIILTLVNDNRLPEVEKAQEIFDHYIWNLSQDENFASDLELQLKCLNAISVLVKGYLNPRIANLPMALELINDWASRIAGRETFARDHHFAGECLLCYRQLLEFFCFTDPEPSVEKCLPYYQKAVELMDRFPDNPSIQYYRESIHDLIELTSKYQRPALWKKRVKVNVTNVIDKFAREEMWADMGLWEKYDEPDSALWDNFYRPFLHPSTQPASDLEIKQLLIDAFDHSETAPDFYDVSHIKGARSYQIPFYKGAILYQVLCALDHRERFWKKEMDIPKPQFGLINLVHIPDAPNPYLWLTGQSATIHDLNEYFDLHLNNPALVNAYTRFFCLMIKYENACFTLMESMADIFPINSSKAELARKAIQKEWEKHKLEGPLYSEENENWKTEHFMTVRSALYKVEMTIEAHGFITMEDDTHLLGNLPICSVQFLEDLMYHFEPSDSINPEERSDT